jgi:hypothetical protein
MCDGSEKLGAESENERLGYLPFLTLPVKNAVGYSLLVLHLTVGE